MHRLRHILAAAIAPLVLGAVMIAFSGSARRFGLTLMIAAVLSGQVTFWLCYLVTVGAQKLLAFQRIPASLIFSCAGFSLELMASTLISVALLNSVHLVPITLHGVITAFASWLSYIVYVAIRPSANPITGTVSESV